MRTLLPIGHLSLSTILRAYKLMQLLARRQKNLKTAVKTLNAHQTANDCRPTGNNFLFSCIFILLSRESDQCAIRARLGVAGHLSTTPRWGIPLSAFPNSTTSKLAGLFSTLSLQC